MSIESDETRWTRIDALLQPKFWGRHPMWTAPGKDLLVELSRDPNPALLGKFYRVRRAWCGGCPSTQHGPGSFSNFEDVAGYLEAIPDVPVADWALDIALAEPPETLSCALLLFGEAAESTRAPELRRVVQAITPLYERCTKAAMLCAETGWYRFRDAALRLLDAAGTKPAAARLCAMDRLPDWRKSAPRPTAVPELHPEASCGLPLEELARRADKTAKCGVLRFHAGTFAVAGATWRVWRCQPRDPSWSSVPHVLVRRSTAGDVTTTVIHLRGANAAESVLDEIVCHEAALRRAAIARDPGEN